MLWPLALVAAGAYGLKRWFDSRKAASTNSAAPADATGPAPAAPPPQNGGGGSSGGGGGGGSAGPYDPGYPMTTDPTYGPPMVALQPIRRLVDMKRAALTNPTTPLVSKTSLLLGVQPAPAVAPFTGAIVSTSSVVPSASFLPRSGTKVLGK